MKKSIDCLVAWWNSFWNLAPESLATQAERYAEKTQSPTSKLYVLSLDFAVKPEGIAAINAGLAPMREKYGLDFIIVEPGMRLTRFDDI